MLSARAFAVGYRLPVICWPQQRRIRKCHTRSCVAHFAAANAALPEIRVIFQTAAPERPLQFAGLTIALEDPPTLHSMPWGFTFILLPSRHECQFAFDASRYDPVAVHAAGGRWTDLPPTCTPSGCANGAVNSECGRPSEGRFIQVTMPLAALLKSADTRVTGMSYR